MKGFANHPYIPNSDPETQREMLNEIGLGSLEELHKNIPDEIKLHKEMDIPKAFSSEYALRRHVEALADKNTDCKKNINFLGAGTYQHFIPALCDEINSRGEFLTGYGGEPYNEEGRFQALFEYASMMAETVGMEVVNVPTMDYAQALATSVRMACRMTGRNEVLFPKVIDRQKLDIVRNYCSADVKLILVECDKAGILNIDDLKAKLNENTAGVYFENPNYFGAIEINASETAKLAHAYNAECIVGVDPITLGVMAPPASYGADIVCGDLQTLGIHMNFGGGLAGFIATRDEPRYVLEYPSRLFGIAPTVKEGEYGFGDVAYDRTSFGHLRESAKEYVGTQTALWGITAGVYLATMGPSGMEQVGKTMLQNSHYAVAELNKLKKLSANPAGAAFMKEFIVDFNSSGKTVKEINKALLNYGIFGGKDLSREFPELGQSALYCVTEIHMKEDIDKLVSALLRILG